MQYKYLVLSSLLVFVNTAVDYPTQIRTVSLTQVQQPAPTDQPTPQKNAVIVEIVLHGTPPRLYFQFFAVQSGSILLPLGEQKTLSQPQSPLRYDLTSFFAIDQATSDKVVLLTSTDSFKT